MALINHEVRFVLTGLGNIGRTLLEILSTRQGLLAERHGLALRCVGVADSTGAAYASEGFDLAGVAALKAARGSVAALPAYDPALSAAELSARAEAELLFEASPTSLRDGQPGLDIVRAALRGGRHAVLASKGPLVLAYAELAALAQGPGAPALRFSGAVGGALPTAALGRHLAGAVIERAELVVNGTTQVILEAMAAGRDFAAALAEAQAQGIVEPDPALDVDGWDAAAKLTIFANAVLGQPTTLADLRVEGISGVGAAALRAAWAAGGRVSLVGTAARRPDGGYDLSVAPATLGPEHPLARLARGEMGLVVHSDLAGRTTMASLEDGPVGTCQAMIRDMVEIYAQVGRR